MVWIFSTAKSRNKTESLQKRALQFLYNDYWISYEGLLEKSGKVKISLNTMRNLCVEIFKAINQKSDWNFSGYLYSAKNLRYNFLNFCFLFFLNANFLENSQTNSLRKAIASCLKCKKAFFRAFSSFWNKIKEKSKPKILPLHGQFFESWKPMNSNEDCRGRSPMSWIHVGGTLKKPCCSKANWINFLGKLVWPLNST